MLWPILGGILGFIILIILIFWLSSEHWRLTLPSTRRLFKEGGWRRFLNLRSLHGYAYLRWTAKYIHTLVGVLAPRLGKIATDWLARRYHGKMLTYELARRMITVKKDIPLTDLEQIIPYPTARKLVLHGPPDIVLSECPCRSFRQNPCQPTQVCMIIGQPFVDFKLEHSPETCRAISQEEALKILEEEHKRGHFHSAWFRDVTLDRFIAICNCCKCCCAGVEGMMRYGSNFISSSGYVVSIDETACSACGVCEQTCSFEAISVNGDVAKADWEKCLGCGACATQCPNDALSLVRDERKGIPMDVRMLT